MQPSKFETLVPEAMNAADLDGAKCFTLARRITKVGQIETLFLGSFLILCPGEFGSKLPFTALQKLCEIGEQPNCTSGPNLPFFALGNAAVQLRQTGHCQWCAAFGEIDGQLCGYIGPMRLRH